MQCNDLCSPVGEAPGLWREWRERPSPWSGGVFLRRLFQLASLVPLVPLLLLLQQPAVAPRGQLPLRAPAVTVSHQHLTINKTFKHLPSSSSRLHGAPLPWASAPIAPRAGLEYASALWTQPSPEDCVFWRFALALQCFQRWRCPFRNTPMLCIESGRSSCNTPPSFCHSCNYLSCVAPLSYPYGAFQCSQTGCR